MHSRLIAIGIAIAAACSAQTPEHTCDSAARLLHSASLNDNAWGAWLAAACHLPNLAPDITNRLLHQRPERLARLQWDSEEFWAGHAMADALVRLNQPLPPKSLEAIAKGFRVEAVLLMLQNAPENIQNLTSIRNSDPRAYESIAAANKLVELRAPGLAAPLLKELTFNNWVWVSDTGTSIPAGTAGSLLGGNGNLKVPDDLPPTGLYRITSQPSPGDEMIADGAIKMYANRTQFETGKESPWENAPEGYCYQCLRIGYLGQLAGISIDKATNIIDRNTPIRWTNTAAAEAEIHKSLKLQIAGLQHVAHLLIASKLMEPDEIDVPLAIAVHIQDSRTNTSLALPQIPPVTFHLP